MEVQLPSATRNFYVDGHKPKPHWMSLIIEEQNHIHILKAEVLFQSLPQQNYHIVFLEKCILRSLNSLNKYSIILIATYFALVFLFYLLSSHRSHQYWKKSKKKNSQCELFLRIVPTWINFLLIEISCWFNNLQLKHLSIENVKDYSVKWKLTTSSSWFN